MAEITGPPPPKGTPAIGRGPVQVPASSRDRQHTGAEARHDEGRQQRTDTSEAEAIRARDPAVSIAAATAHVAVGDNLKAPISSIDREGRPIIVTETATFALRPDAGLKPGDDVTLTVRETGHQVFADLMERNGNPVDPPVRLQLVVIALHSPATGTLPLAPDIPAVTPLPHDTLNATFYSRPLPGVTAQAPAAPEETATEQPAAQPLREAPARTLTAARQAYGAAAAAIPPPLLQQGTEEKAPPPPPWKPGEKPTVTVTSLPGDDRPVIDTGKSLWALVPAAGLKPGDSATLEITRLTPEPEALLTERRGETLNPPVPIRLERVVPAPMAAQERLEPPVQPPAAPQEAVQAATTRREDTPLPPPVPWKQGEKPTVSVTALPGDNRPVIDTGKSLWALDPPAGLKPGDSATLEITRLTPEPQALLTERRGEPVTPPVPLRLERIAAFREAVEARLATDAAPAPTREAMPLLETQAQVLAQSVEAATATATQPPPFREGEIRQVALSAHPASERPVVRIGREHYAVSADRPLRSGSLATIEFTAPKSPAEAKLLFLDGQRLTPPGSMMLEWLPPAATAAIQAGAAMQAAPRPTPPARPSSPAFTTGEVRRVTLSPGPVPDRAFVEAGGNQYLIDPAAGLKPGDRAELEIVRSGPEPEALVRARQGEPVDPPVKVRLHGVETAPAPLPREDAPAPARDVPPAMKPDWPLHDPRVARVDWATASEAQVTIDDKSYRLRPSADLQRGDTATLKLSSDGAVMEAWLTERRGEALPAPLKVQLAPPEHVAEPLIPAFTGPAYRQLYQASEALPLHTPAARPFPTGTDKAVIDDLVAAQQRKLPPLAQAYLKQMSMAPALQSAMLKPATPGSILPYPPGNAGSAADPAAPLGLRPSIVGLASLTAALTQPAASASANPIAALDPAGAAITLTPIKALTGNIPASEVTMARGVRPVSPQEAAGLPGLSTIAGAGTPLAWLETGRGRFVLPADIAASLIGEQVRLQPGLAATTATAAASPAWGKPPVTPAAPARAAHAETTVPASPASASAAAPALPDFVAGKPRHAAMLLQRDGRSVANLMVSFVPTATASEEAVRQAQIPGPAREGSSVMIASVQTVRAYPAMGGPRADVTVGTNWGQFSLSLPAGERPAVGSLLYLHPQARPSAASGMPLASPAGLPPASDGVALPPLEGFPALPPGAAPLPHGSTWPGLESASALMASSYTGSALTAPAPGDLASRAAAGGRLTNALMFLLSAAGRGHPDSWLGDSNVAALEKRDGGLLDLLRRETGRALALAADGSQEWRAVQLPFDIRPNDAPLLYMMFRHEEPHAHERQGGKENGGEDGSDRFVIEISFSKIGTIQLDGRVAGRRFDLVLRSPDRLPAGLEPDLAVLFDSALAANGFTGRFAVQDGRPLEVSVEAAVAGRLA